MILCLSLIFNQNKINDDSDGNSDTYTDIVLIIVLILLVTIMIILLIVVMIAIIIFFYNDDPDNGNNYDNDKVYFVIAFTVIFMQ